MVRKLAGRTRRTAAVTAAEAALAEASEGPVVVEARSDYPAGRRAAMEAVGKAAAMRAAVAEGAGLVVAEEEVDVAEAVRAASVETRAAQEEARAAAWAVAARAAAEEEEAKEGEATVMAGVERPAVRPADWERLGWAASEAFQAPEVEGWVLEVAAAEAAAEDREATAAD